MKIINKVWDEIKLGDITKVITKGTTPTTNGFQYKSSGINFVKVESITEYGRFIKEKFAFIDNDCHSSFKRSQLYEGDLLFSIAGALGRCVIVSKDILPANTNQAVSIIRLKSNVSKNFVYHFLKGYSVKNWISRMNVSTAQANLSLNQLNNFKIPLPSLPEQQKIADILSTVDEKIVVIDQQITATEELKRGLMQRLLTKGIGHTEFKDSPLGEIPKSWDVKKLSKIAKTFAGGTPRRNEEAFYKNGSIPWVKSGEVCERYIFDTEEYITEKALHNSSARLIGSNSLLVALYGATAGQVGILKIEACSNQAVLAVSVNSDEFSISFLYYFLSHFTKSLLRMVQGSGQPNLSKKIVDSLFVPIPHFDEQASIAELLDTVSEKVNTLDLKKKEYQKLKNGLMQKLLTGKIRVNNLIEA